MKFHPQYLNIPCTKQLRMWSLSFFLISNIFEWKLATESSCHPSISYSFFCRMHIKHLFCSWSSCKKNECISHRPTRLSISRVWGMPHLRAEICLALNDRWILRAKANHRKLILEKKMIKKREREITSRIVNFLQGKMKDTELRAIIWQYSCAIKYLTKHQQPNWTSSKNERNKKYIYIMSWEKRTFARTT